MQAILTTEEFAEFEQKLTLLSSKGVELDHTVTVTDGGKYLVILNGDVDINKLDLLTE
tara:strand:- start:53 stop:226 length:174 start_codon:yes stop_codon:yes gene_type:complete